MSEDPPPLSFPFRGRQVPVTFGSSVSRRDAVMTIDSQLFVTWYRRCEQVHDEKQIEIHSVEIQSVDIFGSRGVGFCKINADCTLVDGETHYEHRLPGICFLRGNGVTILVALFCDDGSVYSLLVDQPRVPIGQVSCLELPAGMLDDEKESIAGVAVKEMEEECGITIDPRDLVDLTVLACDQALSSGHIPMAGISPSPGGCDEFIRYMYLEKKVTVSELESMRDRLAGLRDHGEHITLRVVPMDDLWKISADAKAIIALFLVDQLRRLGKLPAAGSLATTLTSEPVLKLSNGQQIPQLAFGLYKIPPTKEGEQAILDAVAAGYRHFDSASFYGNEATLGRALKRSGIPRQDFFIVGKVWNDAVKNGRQAVRASVEQSLRDIDSDYFDLFLIHWPVPGCFVEAYKELEVLCKEGKLRSIGMSNFDIGEYEELVRSGVTIQPVMNQLEVSPMKYRPQLIEYFQAKGVVVGAYKALNRACGLDNPTILNFSEKFQVTPAQIMLRWSLQRGLIPVTKSTNPRNMKENRSILNFALSVEAMAALDDLTTTAVLVELENKKTTTLEPIN